MRIKFWGLIFIANILFFNSLEARAQATGSCGGDNVIFAASISTADNFTCTIQNYNGGLNTSGPSYYQYRYYKIVLSGAGALSINVTGDGHDNQYSGEAFLYDDSGASLLSNMSIASGNSISKNLSAGTYSFRVRLPYYYSNGTIRSGTV